MTTDALVIPPVYTISGTGPYAIPHAYVAQGEFTVIARAAGAADVTLDFGTGWTLGAAGPAASANLTLSASAAAAHAGKSLIVVRATAQEQGFAGANAIDRGLERQLDRTMQAVQDLGRGLGGAVRLRPGEAQPALAPVASAFLRFNTAGQVVAGETLAELLEAAAAVTEPPTLTGLIFNTRAGFVSSVAGGYAPGIGSVVWAGGVAYRRNSSVNILPDLPGWDYVPPLSVRHFGALGDGATNDAPAFQAAATVGGYIHVPSGDYHFADGASVVIPVANFGTTFYGVPGAGTSYAGPSRITTDTVDPDASGNDAPFVFLCSQGKLIDIGLRHRGTPKETGAIAVRFDREFTEDNTDDIDSRVVRCQFTDYGLAIRQNGRGIHATENVFANCQNAIRLTFPTDGLEGDPIQSDPSLGFRTTRITDNRLHNGAALLVVDGDDAAHGVLLASNELDIGDTLFTGRIRDSAIVGNVCRFNGSAPCIEVTGSGARLLIDGNILHGGALDGNPAGTAAILFDTSADVGGAIISNNSAFNLAWGFLQFNAGSRPVGCSITGNVAGNLGRDFVTMLGGAVRTVFANNTARVYGAGTGARGSYRLEGTFTRLSIIGDTWDPVSGDVAIFCVSSPTLTKCLITLNQSEFGTLVTNAFTDGGGNVLTGNIL